jgi:hypothetical protein
MPTGKYKTNNQLRYNVLRKLKAGKNPSTVARETGTSVHHVKKIGAGSSN